MQKRHYKAIPFVLTVLHLMVCVSLCNAANLSEITVASDMKRVAVKFEGKIGSYTDVTAQHPSRLIIEVPGATIIRSPRIQGLSTESGLTVRTAKTPTSARIVMDFGNGPLPEYKIKQMDGYLLVFLADAPLAVPVRNSAVPAPVRQPAVITAPEPTAVSDTSGLVIKSAQVQNGKMVLHVIRESNPGTLYRIDLGVDFDHLGFSSAKIVQAKQASGQDKRSAKIGPIRQPAVQMLSDNSIAVPTE